MFSIKENRCRRFQANIFNKSKCQNCFKPVNSHRLSEADLYQSKPVQVGWLLLAPDGSDFSLPGHRKRKWQRRYFVLYQHGLLRYSLDEMPGTLPQGSVNMTQCCDILDASSQTGFQNCLRLCFAERDLYIRTENPDGISRWQENLSVYPKAANQRKKRKELEHPQQTEELQTSSSSSAKKSSNSGSFNNSIIRRGSLNSNISGGRVSQAFIDALSNTGTSKGSTVSSVRVKCSSSIGSECKGRPGSVGNTVEGVSVISSEKKLEEESTNGGVVVSSGGDVATLFNKALGSYLSPSLEQFPGGSGTDGTKNRLGIESGYSSLEKTSPLVGVAQTHTDSRCDFASDCSSVSQPCMFPTSRSFSSSPFPPPTSHNTWLNGKTEDVVSCSWDRKSLEPIDERHKSMTHTSRTHTLRHNAHQTRSSGKRAQRLSGNQHRRSQVSDQQKSSFLADAELDSTSSSTEQNDHKTAVSRSPDSSPNEETLPRPSTSCSFRSKSLERRIDHAPAPDLLNFKKGWMSRLGEDGKWRKHWFVLTDQTLRFYRDSVAEEAADVDGEINLSTCYDVTDYPVQRNYGFQIHTKDGVFTLCAMTYGIRRNWVQAVMKNIRPTVAPDVTWKQSPLKSSSVPQKVIGACAGSSYNTFPQEEEKRSRICDRRKEGRYKTFDWAELSCKRHKEELSTDQSGREWNDNCEYKVPPAPASSPEGLIIRSESSASEKDCPLKTRLSQSLRNMPTDIPSHSMMVSNHTSPGSISPDSLEVDAGSVRVYCDKPGDPKEKQVNRSTSPLQINFSSSSMQTEWQWEVELQSLRRELKAEHERSQTQERESKLCETKLQSELNNTQGYLQKAELKVQEVESLMKEREVVLEDLRGRLEDVTGCLKATEEAQALKEVRLQRHLRLLQESQERERRSFSDSLDKSEQRLNELEERLRQKEAELQKRSKGEVRDDCIQRCQELQNQLEESESEVSRLQARLHTAETLYYDMEHDYEQACEEIQNLRGALQDRERVCEERSQTQLDHKQQELDRKECELQEVLVKMAVLGSSLEETERQLKEAQTHNPDVNSVTEPQRLFKVSNVKQKMKGKGNSETQPDESDRVISVIQALELKLCDTEDRLRELTMHLQQQQLNTGPYTHNDSSCAHTSIQNLDGQLFVNALQSCTGALNSLQGKAVDRTSDSKDLGGLWLDGESPRSQALGMASRTLSLEAMVIQRMAVALEHPSRELLNRLSDLCVQVLRMDQGGVNNGAVESRYSQIFLYPQEQDQTDGTLSENVIQRLCVRAEMAYLIHTLHTHPSQEQQGSEPFKVLPWKLSDSSVSKENVSKQGPKLADISPPELAPYSEQMEELAANLLLEDSEVQLACRKNLVAELRAQARSLQDLSTHLHSDVQEADVTELPTGMLRVAVCQATLAYMACRLRTAVQQEMNALCKQREQAEYEARAMCRSMDVLFQEQTEHYEEKLREGRVVAAVAEQGRVCAETNAQFRVDEAERLQMEFEVKLQELQKIHEEEMSRLHKYYIHNMPKPKTPTLTVQEENGETQHVSVTALQDRIRELQSEVIHLKQELSKQDVKAFQLDLENVKATYEHGFTIMEESHQRVIEEMQRQHQREVERLTEERERVLLEETNATIAAIEAMRKAHKEEMDKTHKALQNGASVDICQLHAQYNEELKSLHRELEVLSEQYSQKCLENTHLTQTVEAEREALGITQRENQELRTHNRELNECLAAELSLMHSRLNGEHTQSFQEKDIYQLEVNLRVKESEIKCLKQEINSLKLELQAANTHFKDLQSELSPFGVEPQSDFTKLRMEPIRKQSLKYDLMKSRSNPEVIKDCSTLSQAVGSQDGLTVLERMKLFELTGAQKI